jgi:hypothetical protein
MLPNPKRGRKSRRGLHPHGKPDHRRAQNENAMETIFTLPDFLDEVRLILDTRGTYYGDANECFTKIAALWNAAGFNKSGISLSPVDVAVAMILLKIGRGTDPDGWRDIAGYAALGAKLQP